MIVVDRPRLSLGLGRGAMRSLGNLAGEAAWPAITTVSHGGAALLEAHPTGRCRLPFYPADEGGTSIHEETVSVNKVMHVVVVDDSPTMLKTVLGLVASIPNAEVVGKASTGLDALEVTARLQPDLVLMDCSMPVMDGLEATSRITARPLAPIVIMMTAHELPAYRAAALAAGARGFVIKAELAERLPAIFQDLDRISSAS